jgi:hypothetical protein
MVSAKMMVTHSSYRNKFYAKLYVRNVWSKCDAKMVELRVQASVCGVAA